MVRKNNSAGISLVFAVLLCSCGSNYRKGYSEIEVEEKIFRNATPVEYSSISGENDFVHAKQLFVISDSIILASNRPGADYFIDFYDLETKRLLTKYIRSGNGPGEALNCDSSVSDGTVYVNDFVRKELLMVNIDSALNDGNYKVPSYPYSHGKTIPSISGRGDSVYFLNPYCLEYKPYHTGKPRYFSAKKFHELPDDAFNHRLNTFNVSQGELLVKPGGGTIAFFSLNYPFVEFYSSPESPYLRINFPSNIEQKFRTEGNEVIFNGFIHYTFTGASCDDEYLYGAYVDDVLTRERDMEAFSTYIVKMNWCGDILGCYFFPYCITSLSKTQSTLYGKVERAGIPYIYKITLPKS